MIGIMGSDGARFCGARGLPYGQARWASQWQASLWGLDDGFHPSTTPG